MTWTVDDLGARYGHRTVLAGISLRIEPGRNLAVIGGDGAGKSTLLKALAGLDVSQTGSLDLPPARRIAYVPGGGGVFNDLTVDENVEFIGRTYGLASTTRRERAAPLLTAAELDRFGDRLAGSLSGGQRRKLAAVLALLPEPAMLILDEVTTGVDPVSRLELWRMISGAMARGAAVVSATTYLDEAERADQVVLLHDGRMLANGSPDDIVATAPGGLIDVDAPLDPPRAWRVGRRWRQWQPGGDGGIVRLADAAVVLELAATEEARLEGARR